MRLPSDIMDLNDLGQRVSHNFSDFAIKTSVFREYAAGISMDINSDLTVGGKVKLLQGLGMMSNLNRPACIHQQKYGKQKEIFEDERHRQLNIWKMKMAIFRRLMQMRSKKQRTSFRLIFITLAILDSQSISV